MSDHHLSLNSMEKLIRDAGAERVSRGAKERLRQYLENHGREVAELALTYTEHAGRTTVQKEDITSSLDAR